MAGKADYLIINTVNDSNLFLSQVQQLKTTATRIVQRMLAMTDGATDLSILQGYVWPAGYTQANFITLYNALKDLPGSVVDDATRDALFALVSSFQ